MTTRMRLPFFAVAFVAWVFVLLLEVGSSLLKSTPSRADFTTIVASQGSPAPTKSDVDAMYETREANAPPGYAIRSMAAFDGIVLLGLIWMALAVALPKELVGRLQGIGSLIVALLLLIGAVIAIMTLFSLLMLMLGLFLAAPFGTIAYLAIWGYFDKGTAAWILSIDLVLKLVAAVALLLAQFKFIENKGLVILFVVSMLLDVAISWAQGFPPSLVVSIADVIAALVILVLTAVWSLVLLVSSLLATLKALKPEVNVA